MASIFKWGITDGMRLARTVGKELENPSSYSSEELIEAAEKAKIKHPNEWVVFYSLSDKYQSLGLYEQGLESARKCVELKPDDIRSTYALATAYNLLTRAEWSEKESQLAKLLEAQLKGIDIIDKKYSQAGLDHTGLAIETAAVQAIRWFERSLMLQPNPESHAIIQRDITALYKRFPHLQK